MGNYFSPEGNYEVWEKKPEGYLTLEEWQELHPPEPPEPPPPPTPEELTAQFKSAVAARLNAFARERQYDSIQNAMLMSDSAMFNTDGQPAINAYDMTWSVAIVLIPQVANGTLSIDDAIAQLPVLKWPE